VNPDSCTNADNCTDAFVCVGAVCVATDDACGAGGCAGNQVCTYDDAASTATCGENPTGCSSALDCSTDRICDGGVCAAPSACINDSFEPNDAVGEEINYAAANSGLPIELALCGTDVDRISYVTTDDADLTGTLVAEVNIHAADVGLGVLALDLLNESGTSVGTARTELNGAPTGTARVEFAITAINGGKYTLVVSDGGDVSTAGVRYSARMDVVDAAVVTACAAPTALTIGAPVTGTTVGGSTALLSSCGDTDGLNGEDVYSFTIDRPVVATFVASPLTATADLVVNVRSVCEQTSSELGCSDGTGSNNSETLALKLSAGTYAVVVEGYSPTSGGQFALSVAVEDVICSAADNTCLDPDTANVCNENGTGFDSEACDDGCEAAAGVCARPAGDLCSNAFPVTNTTPFSGVINRSAFLNDYDPGDASCVPNNSNSQDTDGPDTVWAVTVPNGSVVAATVSAVDYDDTTIYIVEDCADVSNSCLAGVNAADSYGAAEKIFWHNDSGAEKTVFLIADVEDESSYGSPSVTISVQPFVCEPSTSRCVLNRESQRCNATGTGYDSTTPCDEGCDVATGQCTTSNDTCEFATVLEFDRDGLPGVTTSLTEIGNYTDATANCGSSTTSRLDAVYVLPNLQVGDVVSVAVAADFDSIISTHIGCSVDTFDSCLGSVDGAGGGQNTETLGFNVTTAGDYYILVQPYYSSDTTGTFTVRATVTPPACVPGTLIGCSADQLSVETCSLAGQINTSVCGGGCQIGVNGAECVTKQGEACFDALPIDVSALASGTTGSVDGVFSGTSDVNIGSGQLGYCHFDDADAPDGIDTVYEFTLNAGQLLKLDLLSTRSTSQMYIMKDCYDANTCYGYFNNEGATATIEYYATAPEKIFVIIDSTSSTTSASDQFTLSYKVTTGAICAPNTTRCNGGNSVEVCGADGTSSETYACPGACSNGACVLEPTTADTCTGAPDIGAGGYFFFDSSSTFTNTVTDACSDTTAGKDAFVKVTVPAGSNLKAIASSYGNETPALYITEDCADVANTCAAYVEGTSANNYSASIRNLSPLTKTYYIGLDATAADSNEDFYLLVDVKPVECTPGPAGCNMAGNSITYCENGFNSIASCGTNGTCSNGACTNVNNDYCLTAAPISGASGQIAGSWLNANPTRSMPYGTVGACSVSSSPTGDDRFYSFDLLAGQVFKASITIDPSPSFYADEVLYVVGNCLEADSCLAYTYSDGVLYYQATVDQKVVLVVDKTSTSYDIDFTVDWEILSNVACVPGSTVCADATTIASCAADGSAVANYQCLYSCDSGACTVDTTLDNACDGNTPVISGSTIIKDDFTAATNSVEIPSGTCGTNSSGSDGQDLVYLLDIPAYTRVEARLTEISSTYGWSTLYLFTDCGDAATSCLAGDYASSGYASVTYQTGAVGEQVYVAIDLDDPVSGPLIQRFEVEYFVPDCDPATYTQACNLDETGFTYCNDGFLMTYLCSSTCNTTSNSCDTPTGDVCIDAFEATPPVIGTPLVFTDNLGNFTNDYDLGTGNACTSSRTIGAEPVYLINLLAGQVLTASVVSDETTPEDLALYITDACINVRTQCLGGADNEGGTAVPEQLTYTATADGPVYLMVDSFYSTSSGDFTLNVTIN